MQDPPRPDNETVAEAWLGIDPGATEGALAWLIPARGRYGFHDWNRGNLRANYQVLEDLVVGHRIRGCLLERFGALRSPKATAVFCGNGSHWEAFLTVLRIPFLVQDAKEWSAGLIIVPAKTPKDQRRKRRKALAIQVAQRLFPALHAELEGRDGRAEALLMAHRARELF